MVFFAWLLDSGVFVYVKVCSFIMFSGICFFNQSITQTEEKVNFQIKRWPYITFNNIWKLQNVYSWYSLWWPACSWWNNTSFTSFRKVSNKSQLSGNSHWWCHRGQEECVSVFWGFRGRRASNKYWGIRSPSKLPNKKGESMSGILWCPKPKGLRKYRKYSSLLKWRKRTGSMFTHWLRTVCVCATYFWLSIYTYVSHCSYCLPSNPQLEMRGP